MNIQEAIMLAIVYGLPIGSVAVCAFDCWKVQAQLGRGEL